MPFLKTTTTTKPLKKPFYLLHFCFLLVTFFLTSTSCHVSLSEVCLSLFLGGLEIGNSSASSNVESWVMDRG